MPSPKPMFEKLDKIFMDEYGIEIKNPTFWELIKYRVNKLQKKRLL
jgi:hypothetical protein